MKRILAGAAGLALASVIGSAVAGEVGEVAAAASQKVPTEAVQQDLESMGYRVLGIDVQEDRYEFRIVNEIGIPVQAMYDATTGELVSATLE